MKITIDVDLTSDELRQFLGLPNVEKLQAQMLDNAQQYLREAGNGNYKELIATAMQPMVAYQQWLQQLMGATKKGDTSS